ncbi:TetR/AcrR family transcriptional regulator [Streptomyces sp. DW4-2]|uniref:TetR/AcrR family transcriptional regulator n=1 Tax=Streptomyces spirodelae TaxID=2812904 RepID=A0ABS3WNM8_9ACTN|nr:TetR/AcrR family transcriptional regulator [Streptomyces spirodelae]
MRPAGKRRRSEWGRSGEPAVKREGDSGVGSAGGSGVGAAAPERERGVPLPAGKTRGRPRSEAVERAIVEAVTRLLEEGVSYEALSIERIARTAGVGKAAVYRRWSGKDELFLYVVRELEELPYEGPREGPLREVLVGALEWLREVGLAKRRSALLRVVAGQVHSHPGLWQRYRETVVGARRERLAAVLRRGIDHGELRGDIGVDVLIDLLTAPILARILLREGEELPEEMPRQIVDAFLDGLRPRT